VADVRPEAEVESFGDDFPVAEAEDARLCRPFALAVWHRVRASQVLLDENFDRPAHHVIIAAVSEEILQPKR
jgi:hypothetical protein